ncbi:MAG: substrate-binding domain-containing protein [Chloroflexi bacterium]|nr:substrate-binding domain-containing protein [Chloroflexota bacterium]
MQKVGSIFIILVLASLAAALGCSRSPKSLTLATTTSTYDTGLLDALVPPFEKANKVKVKVVAVGTGQALALGERGDADVLLVHDPKGEAKFVADGFGVERQDVMYNDFVIVGPSSDPAGIKNMKIAAQAFTQIAQRQTTFISRGDESGTHTKEKTIWQQAGISPQGSWYQAVGQGMGATLNLASEKGAYTLTDRGTYLAYQRNLGLTILVEGDEALRNQYGVIAVNPARLPKIKYDLARKFIDYITSSETQKVIANFGRDKYGQSLFFPNASNN